MDRTNWNDRRDYDRDNRRNNRDRGNDYWSQSRPVDEDRYRGSYRLDNSSEDRNESTWDWNERRNNGNGGRDNYNSNYNRDYNRNYNNDYNRNYNGGNRMSDRSNFDDDYTRDSRYQYRSDSGDSRNWDEQYRPNSGGYGTRFGGNPNGRNADIRSVRSRIADEDRYGTSNFNGDYGPDNYGTGRGDNYGNMAGSLSYGYDGTSNYDPDWNRYYEPQSGERRSYHGNYTSRHPERSQYQNNASRNPSDHGRDRY
ncbi:hypothetical protein CLV24_10294 [Pontibacter ummariensis]|uniref:Uncharacterized protein n=1 Tax=Pontibacter ummariensis TaxID=1610492 RepID=A0A239C5D6_9BACT|nr:hypothetical protein [Pontibacter ummariensis]PRY15473.1 hypothetical protein CLV24_10294 [Pontibacter ummariensis]SNS14634.1 hypothetical protein SAMN06296052_102319 [Pontibacter ummariensis]